MPTQTHLLLRLSRLAKKLPSTQTDKHGCFSQSRLALCLIYSPASDPGRAELDGLLAPLLLLQLDTHILM